MMSNSTLAWIGITILVFTFLGMVLGYTIGHEEGYEHGYEIGKTHG